ncbi:MAG: tetratricopeptide repeat protein [Caldilineaceae bacterium]|nr:tetratricopeptide repeat protein [Caldilineaceae bacterium]
MTPPTFSQLLSEYMLRSGISDSELARSIGVRRQTIFRWKEGLVERPRSREDVLRCANKLRLDDAERDRLLLAAGFAPEQLTVSALVEVPPAPGTVSTVSESTTAELLPTEASSASAPLTDAAGDEPPPVTAVDPSQPEVVNASAAMTADVPPASVPNETGTPISPIWLTMLASWWPVGAGLLVVALVTLLWLRREPGPQLPPPLTPLPPVTVELHAPPQTTPVALGDHPIAAAGETLVLVAQLKDYTLATPYNVAGRITEELSQQIGAAGLISTTVQPWPEEITTVLRARQLLTAAQATLVIWGEYDSGRVRVNLEARDPRANQSRNFTLSPDDELVTTINAIVPVEIRNTALLALGSLVTDQGQYQMTVGRLLRDEGNYQAAAILFERALELNPTATITAANLNFYLGYLAEKTVSVANYDQAIAYYTRALAINPRLIHARYNRGSVHLIRTRLLPANEALIVGSLDAAIADLTQVIAERPDYVNAYLNRALAYYERDLADDMTMALADLNQVIATRPNDPHAYFNRGLVYIRRGTDMQWVEDFQQALVLDPNYTGVISALCWGYALAQQTDKALPYCNQAVLLDKTGLSHDSRGIVYSQLGRYADAIADFQTYLDSLRQEQAVTLYARYRGPLVEQWIAQLTAGENPIHRELLEQLRHRDHY